MTHKYLPYQLALIYLVNKRTNIKHKYYFNQKHITDLTFQNHKFLNQVLKEKYLSTLYK